MIAILALIYGLFYFYGGASTGFITPFFKWNIFNYGRIKNNVRVQDALFEQG